MDAYAGKRTAFVDRGVHVTAARVGAFLVEAMVFPGGHAGRLDPEDGYVAIVLEGGVEKTFARRSWPFPAGRGVAMPAGALHTSKFTAQATTVVAITPLPGDTAAPAWMTLLSDVRELRAAPCVAIGWRLAGELRSHDDAWPLAAEGLCLELGAALLRERAPTRTATPPPWLESVRERIHARLDDGASLAELAADAGVHPAYLARSFRRRYGVAVGEYARRTRLAWAAAQLSSTETPLAALAAEAGFADQSHFTRAFKRYSGLTPGRYRRVVRS